MKASNSWRGRLHAFVAPTRPELGRGADEQPLRSRVGLECARNEVWALSTLLAPDRLVRPPDLPGFRMFPPLPSVRKPKNPVRVPHRARHTYSSEGVFAFACVHFGWSGPSDTGRTVCLAPRVACLIVGERVQGSGRSALRVL